MFRDKVISRKIIVNNQEMVYFSIRLPDNATQMIGVEYGVRFLGDVSLPESADSHVSSFAIALPVTVGNLRLEHPGCSGLFYSTSVKAPDTLIGFGDFSIAALFKPQVFTHAKKNLEDPVLVPKQARLITGIYQNIARTRHELLVHLWYAIGKGGTA
ncbi:MAG TPA: hypothetical protein VD905_19640 [Flavobacteriales bacterium]|nr:hypothetical protein [Flavobacteriales bacterium]